MKVIGKRKPFKTNNSSGFLYGLHNSNNPTRGGEMSRMLWGKVIAQQLMSFTIVLNKMMHNCEWSFLQHYCEGVGRLDLSLEGEM